jgi:hypothetical protein
MPRLVASCVRVDAEPLRGLDQDLRGGRSGVRLRPAPRALTTAGCPKLLRHAYFCLKLDILAANSKTPRWQLGLRTSDRLLFMLGDELGKNLVLGSL